MTTLTSNDSLGDPLAPPSRLYRAVWRWHFYAGLICLPFLALMAITGGLYLFNHEIDQLVYRDLLTVPARSSAELPANALTRQALAAVAGTLKRYVPPATASASAEVGVLAADGRKLSVYVNPANGQVLGSIEDSHKLMTFIKKLHSLAVVGTLANYWVEVVAGWSIVLVVTGVYLWWPRGRTGGVVTVRGAPAKRLWWRDVHAVTGAFAGAVILFLAVTGMPWSAFWGSQFGKLTNSAGLGLPAYLWDDVPQSTIPLTDTGEVAWTLQQATLPQSPGAQVATANASPAHAITLAQAVAAFDAAGLPRGYSVALPANAEGVFTASRFPADVTQERVVHLDQYTGQVLVDVGFADYGVAGKATELGITLHTGQQFGLFNQLLMLAGCLAIVLLAVSAVVMWWKRKPSGKLGAPVRKDGERVARNALIIAAVLGLIYPLLGASMLVVLLVEALMPKALQLRFGL